MLQICTSERRATPGPSASTATRGPTGAEVQTHGFCITAVVTSHRCTGLVGRKDGRMARGKRKFGEEKEVGVGERNGEEERNCEGMQRQMLPSRISTE